MAERFTIMYENEPEPMSRAEKKSGEETVENLQLDRALRIICPDYGVREAFLRFVSEPLRDENEIKKRAEVICEFKKKPELLVKLTEHVRKLSLDKKLWENERGRLAGLRRANPQDKSLTLVSSNEQLVLTCHFLRIVLLTLNDIHESLNMMGVSSEWLVRLKDKTEKIACRADTEKLLPFAAGLERDLPGAYSYELELELNDEMSAAQPFLTSIEALNYNTQQQKKSSMKKSRGSLLGMLMNQREERSEPALPEADESKPIYGVELDRGLDMSAKAVNELNRYLTSFLRVIFDRYSALEDELNFMKAALMYIERFESRGVRYVYPELLPSENGVIRIKELSDLLLLTESASIASVVPNDVMIDPNTSGILVTGRNNSGKTVFLRSVGCAVLLAQCGLPIPASSAVISVRGGIYTAFAKSEGELVSSSSAGRFEEEVAQLSEIISRIGKNSLVLLNETFQTTSYDEGSDGMSAILHYLGSMGCGFIFVTHLTKLIASFGKSGTVMKTSDDFATKYKISKVS